MLDCYTSQAQHAIPIKIVNESDFPTWLPSQPALLRNWAERHQFTAKVGQVLIVPDSQGNVETVVVGEDNAQDMWGLADLANKLPQGEYQVANPISQQHMQQIAITWGLANYQFDRYKKTDKKNVVLQLTETCQANFISELVQSIYLVRDLINTPTEDMGPPQLAEVSQKLAKQYAAKCEVIVGEKLLKHHYPAIHAVGRGSVNAPRLIDLRWGDKHAPKVTLVGKGVCFDTGGLDLKPSRAMTDMKKDMAGAAHVLGLARLIMSQNLPIQLRVLIPAVENAIGGNVYRPGDVIQTRKGLTVEITNTDAEGRMVLSDALTEAASETPEMIIDFATLTGAGRVALGTDIPALFANQQGFADNLLSCGEQVQDILWQLPLYKPYRELLESPIADLKNAVLTPYGGAITAALFLNEFVPNNIPWAHLDLMAWNTKNLPGRPEGGEAMGLRAVYEYISAVFLKQIS
jgi:leucyl aminopeptidase